MIRSPGSWWGEALLGPEATIQNRARSHPSSTVIRAMSWATSASWRPENLTSSGIRANTRSTAAAANRRASSSSVVFLIRRSRVTPEAATH